MSTISDRRRRWHPLGVLCAVCRRPARGFGWADPVHAARPRPSVWFCSIACQNFWWRLAQRSPAMMVDITDQEQAAVAAAVKSVAEIMQEIGWSTRFQDLTKEQVLMLITAAVSGFQNAMHATARIDASRIPS